LLRSSRDDETGGGGDRSDEEIRMTATQVTEQQSVHNNGDCWKRLFEMNDPELEERKKNSKPKLAMDGWRWWLF
jgi:hypothetical protein